MTTTIDLDAYFHRIGYPGESRPTLVTLRALHVRHARAIAFENLDPLLRRPVRLDLPSLEQKLVRDGRGGYCFEQNLLFSHALQALGYRVTGLAARVLWNQPEGALTPRSHMLLRVEVEGETYVADVGFGVSTPTGPLRLEPDTVQATPHESFRLLRQGDEYLVQAQIRGGWMTLYRFDLQPQLLPDYEVSSWYVSNHPDSHFITALFAARPVEGGRLTLRNNELAAYSLDGITERRTLGSAAELRETLGRDFGLNIPQGTEVDAAFERLIAR